MDTTPDHLDPDHLDDEVLSALLDGPLSHDRGAGEPDAAAHLAGCERCAGRQAELASARAALTSAPVEPIDELTRRRLVATALRAAGDTGASGSAGRLRRLPRHPALVGSAAAVILALLVGVPFVMGNDKGGSDTTLTAQAPADLREESAAGTYLGDLGDLGDRENVRLRLGGAGTDTGYGLGGLPPAAPTASPAPAEALTGGGSAASSPSPVSGARSAGPTTTTAMADDGGAGSSSNAAKSSAEGTTADAATGTDSFSTQQPYAPEAADRDRIDTDRCVAALQAGPAQGGRLIRSGTGTYQGRPAIVASFELDGGTVAFVADRSTCEVLDRYSV